MTVTKAAGATEKKTVDSNGTKLHVQIDGPEGAPWVVLIHSLGANAALFDGQAAALAQQYRVLRYDMRGHGKSAAPRGPYSMNVLTDDLFGLFSRFKIARTHVVGVSLGALTALAAAQRNAPQIASIVFCSARVDLSPKFVKMIDDRNRVVRDQGMNSIAKLMAMRWLAPATFSGRPDVARKVEEMVRTTPVEGFVACAEAIKTHRVTERLTAVKVPSLFIAGDQDPSLSTEAMHRVQVTVPHSSFSVLIGASHLANLDQPHSFNVVLGNFLRKHTA